MIPTELARMKSVLDKLERQPPPHSILLEVRPDTRIDEKKSFIVRLHHHCCQVKTHILGMSPLRTGISDNEVADAVWTCLLREKLDRV